MVREDKVTQAIVDLLPETGEIEFQEWQDTIAAQRLRGNAWLKAKHARLIQTRVEPQPDGSLKVFVSRASA